MAEFETGSATETVAAPTMTYGLNDMGDVPSEATRSPPQPRPLPPNHDIMALLRNPALAGRFDQKWGEGVASKILGTYRLAQSSSPAESDTSDPATPAGNVPQVAADDAALNEPAQAAAAFEAGALRLRRTAARHIALPGKTYDVAPDQLPSDVDPNLVGQVPGLLERLKLNAQDSKFRSGALGSAYLAAVSGEAAQADRLALPPDVERRRAARKAVQEEIFANLVRYDLMDPFGTAAEGVAALFGQMAGSLTSPEGLAGVPAKGASVAARIGRAMWQQGLIDAVSDAFVQFQSIKSGVQKDHDWWRTAFARALGAGSGALGRTAVEGAAKAPDVIANRRLQRWRDATPNKTWDDHYRTAQRWQDELAAVNEPIAQETGTRFDNPGIKARDEAEKSPGASRVIADRKDVTDVVRGAHMLERPSQADVVVDKA